MNHAEVVRVHVPAVLRRYCDGASELLVSAGNVGTALGAIELRHPALYSSVCDETGRVRRHVNLFVNTDHIRDRQGLETALAPGDVVIIIPAVSGG